MRGFRAGLSYPACLSCHICLLFRACAHVRMKIVSSNIILQVPEHACSGQLDTANRDMHDSCPPLQSESDSREKHTQLSPCRPFSSSWRPSRFGPPSEARMHSQPAAMRCVGYSLCTSCSTWKSSNCFLAASEPPSAPSPRQGVSMAHGSGYGLTTITLSRCKSNCSQPNGP